MKSKIKRYSKVYISTVHINLKSLFILFIIYKPSKFVVPEFAYNKAVPNKIKHELNPPKKK